MKKLFMFYFLFFLPFNLSSCGKTLEETSITNNDEHEHTWTYVPLDNSGHYKIYTCGCESEKEIFVHFDEDEDDRCDACIYNLDGLYNGSNFALGTYYLPYSSKYDPIALRFDENNMMHYIFEDENNKLESCKYDIIDGYIYIYIGKYETEKYHVFEITNYGIVLDSKKTTANLWDNNIYSGEEVIFYLEGATKELIISSTYQFANELSELPKIEKIYESYEINGNDAYAVMMDEATTAVEWSEKIIGTDYTFTYNDGSEILIYYNGAFYGLNRAYNRGYISEVDLAYLNKNHHNCEIAHSYDQGLVVLPEEQTLGDVGVILYTCTICGDTETVGIPQDFSFAFTFGFDGYYNSLTGELKNGYNYDLGVECKTTLNLTQEQLLDVYRIFYNGNINNYQDGIRASEDLMEPSFTIKITYSINYEEYNFNIYGATGVHYMSDWDEGYDFGYAYKKVLNEFIYISEEYKSLPPNQNMYD